MHPKESLVTSDYPLVYLKKDDGNAISIKPGTSLSSEGSDIHVTSGGSHERMGGYNCIFRI